MATIKQTGIMVTGHREDDLKAGLEAFYDGSVLAKTLLDAAGKMGTAIKSDQGADNIHADGTTVNLFWQKKKAIEKPEALGLAELVESALFEIKNVVNASRRAGISHKFNCLKYGMEFASIEAESSFYIASIINQRTDNYAASDWGKKQVAAVDGKDLAAFTLKFISEPHDVNGLDQMKLQSKHLYAYEQIKNIGILKTHLYDFVTVSHKRNNNTKAYDNNAARKPGATQAFNKDWEGLLRCKSQPYKCQVFVWLIRAILEIRKEQQGWSVTWKDNVTNAQWTAFIDDIVLCVGPVQDNPENVTKIKEELKKIIIA